MDGHFALEQNKIPSMVKASLRVKLCVSKVVLTNISAISDGSIEGAKGGRCPPPK